MRVIFKTRMHFNTLLHNSPDECRITKTHNIPTQSYDIKHLHSSVQKEMTDSRCKESDSLSLASEVGQQRAFCKISIAAVYIIVKN